MQDVQLSNGFIKANNSETSLNSSFLPGGNAIFLVKFGDLNKWGYVTINKSRLIF